jgi:hypothetical protein
VGYGDLKVQQRSSKIFIIFYIVISTIFIAGIIRSFNAGLIEQEQLRQYRKNLAKMQSLPELYRNSESGAIHSSQLILDLLLYSGKLDQATDIDPWVKVSSVRVYSIEIYPVFFMVSYSVENREITKSKR